LDRGPSGPLSFFHKDFLMESDQDVPMEKVKFARLKREISGSFLTIELPSPIVEFMVDDIVATYFEGWKVIQTSLSPIG
jgi:hypothetical protein